MFFISDEEVQAAFDVLHDGSHAKARATYEYAERRLKVAFAKALTEAEGKTVGEREANAQLSKSYAEALTHFRVLAENYYELRDKREAAAAVIEAWRTQRSDQRAMRNAA